MYRPFRIIALLSAVILSLMLVAVAAQTVPALFVGTVRGADGRPLADAQLVARVAGQVCSEATSGSDGSYGLPVPDRLDRPAGCAAAGLAASIYVNGSLIANATIGVPGEITPLDLTVGAGPGPATLTLAFSGAPLVGANSVAVVGGPATAQQVQAAAEAQSGLKVQAIWLFSGGQWTVYVPNLVAQFSAVTPPVALFIILG